MEIINAPGKVGISPRLVRADAHHWKRSDAVSAIFFTEMADNHRAAALSEEGDGFTLTHDESGPGKGECAILTRDSARTVIATEWIQITDGDGTGRLSHPNYAVAVVTEAPSGRRTLLSGAHLEAHIEGIWARIPLPDRIKVRVLFRNKHVNAGIRSWIGSVHRWREGVAALAAKYHVDDIVIAPDGNMDAHKPWVREMIARAWPGLTLAVTKANDLDHRAVGWVLTTMTHDGGHVYRAESSDHNAGRYVLRHLNPPKVVKVVKPPPPFQLCTYNGARMDQKTQAFVQVVEKRLGYSLTILQGCYNAGQVAASAGTHDAGGVVDLAPFDFARKVHAWRATGGFGWHRLAIPGVWGEHIHGGIRNQGNLSASAAQQQRDYDARPARDGLAGHLPDPTWHPDPPVGFDYPLAWHEIHKETP